MVYTHHSRPDWKIRRSLYQKFHDFLLLEILYKKSLPKADFRIAISKFCQNELALKYGVSSKYVPNGVNQKAFHPIRLESVTYKKGDPTLLHVGRWIDYKAVDKIILSLPSIIKEYPKVHLILIGLGKEARA